MDGSKKIEKLGKRTKGGGGEEEERSLTIYSLLVCLVVFGSVWLPILWSHI